MSSDNSDILTRIEGIIEKKFEAMKHDIESKFEAMKHDIESKFEAMKHDIESKFEAMKHDIEALRKDMNYMKDDIELLQAKKMFKESHSQNLGIINPSQVEKNVAAIFDEKTSIPYYKNF